MCRPMSDTCCLLSRVRTTALPSPSSALRSTLPSRDLRDMRLGTGSTTRAFLSALLCKERKVDGRVLYEVVLGIILGALLGWVARKVMKFSEAKKLIDRQSYVAQYISLAVLSIGFTSLLGSDDLLSAFACGCAFAWDGFFNKATEDAEFSNVIDLLFNCAAFIYIGAIIPFDSFNDPRIYITWWRLLVLAILVLLLRRLPAILALYKWIPDIKTFREALFTGWFGPMGVGAVFISTLAKHSIPEGAAEKDTEQVDLLRECIVPIVMFLVLTSIICRESRSA